MQMREVIEKVSELYRDARGEASEISSELWKVRDRLEDAKRKHFDNITHAEYQSLVAQEDHLTKKLDLQHRYSDGMSAVRELLMDMGFNTEVTN